MASDGRTERRPSGHDVTGAKLLADHVRRLNRSYEGEHAVHLQFREGRTGAADAALCRLALRPLEDLAAAREAAFFPLSRRACAIVCRAGDRPMFDGAIAECGGGAGDPLLAFPPAQPAVRWFNLAHDDDRLALLALARFAATPAEGPAAAKPAGEPLPRPLDPRAVGDLCGRLDAALLADLAEFQPVLTLAEAGSFAPLFQEVYVSMASLRARLAPGVDLFARPALFRYLTEIIDQHMLRALARGLLPGSGRGLSVNLNICSVLSPAFAEFLAAPRRPSPLAVELQVSDLLAHPRDFVRAAAVLRDANCRVVIDGLSPAALAFFDAGAASADFVKIAWDDPQTAIEPAARRADLAERIAAIGRGRVIFSRVETVEAVRSALELGVTRVQGRFIDRLVGALAGHRGDGKG